ncbi:MAG: hypothetical protein CVV03_05080 [Firmicutes bacterium HGW-Firmicutes-8]|nr:MAG: hypothetical protein CVV03_05080 [Firmicutes bacterium HGW-Firmicutes-8]
MLLVLMASVLIWIAALAAWIFISLFVHELFHLWSAFICRLEVKRYRLITIPGRGKGYVDVLIPKGTKYYLLKRGLVHLSGIIAHLSLVLVSLLMFMLSGEVVLSGIWLEGLIVNTYLMIMNMFPEDSDGRQFWDMIKKA